MICLHYFFLYILYAFNSLSNIDFEYRPFEFIFYQRELGILKNYETGIECVDFVINNPIHVEKDTKQELLYLFQSFSYNTPLIPVKIFVSITFYDRYFKNINEFEVEKIIKFIIDCKDNEKISYQSSSIFTLDIIKIHNNKSMKDLFDLMPDLVASDPKTTENIKPCFYHFFIFEDISNNEQLKILLRYKIRYFFINRSKSQNLSNTFVSLIAAFKNLDTNFIKNICHEITKLVNINKLIVKAGFTNSEVLIKHDHYKIKTTYEKFFKTYPFTKLYQNSDKKVYLNKNLNVSIDENNKYLIHFLRYSSSKIFLEIQKIDYKPDAGEKLFNFLGYGPFINSFSVFYKRIGDYKIEYKHDILVIVEEIELFNYRTTRINQKSFMKKIIISNYDNSEYCELISCSYIIEDKNLVGFPLTPKEKDIVEELAYKKNIEACKLLNYINLYECIVLSQSYFYFYKLYPERNFFTDKICFYQREINYYDISEYEINIMLLNAFIIPLNTNIIFQNGLSKIFKTIEVYRYETLFFRKFTTVNNHDNKEDVFKGLRDHYIDKIELSFFDNIEIINNNDYDFIDEFKEYFIKIDFGYNKEYIILFKKSVDENAFCERFYNYDFIYEKVFKLLISDFSYIFNIHDIDIIKVYLKEFLDVVLHLTKYFLFNNFKIRAKLIKNLMRKIECFIPEIQDIIVNYYNFEISETSETEKYEVESYDKIKKFEFFLNKLIIIIRKYICTNRHEAYILVSLLNEKDESDSIFDLLRCNGTVELYNHYI